MKRAVLALLVLMTFIVGLASCSSGPTATSSPTLAPAATPPPLQAAGWEEVTVHTLCLAVEQSYPQIEGEFSQPIAETARRILAGLGLQVLDEGAACEASLTLSFTAQALGADYMVDGYLYTGAEVNGQMTLAVTGREPLVLRVGGFYPTPSRVEIPIGFTIHIPRQPKDAPFDKAWSEALVDGLAQVWGTPLLTQALQDEAAAVRWAAVGALTRTEPKAIGALPALIEALAGNENVKVRQAAAAALGGIGPEATEAIPALIQALEDEDEVRQFAIGALKHITGQDFELPGLWRQWWKEQQ